MDHFKEHWPTILQNVPQAGFSAALLVRFKLPILMFLGPCEPVAMDDDVGSQHLVVVPSASFLHYYISEVTVLSLCN